MSEIISTSPEPAYLARLGLNSLPFGKNRPQDCFYTGQHIGQCKDLILHLLRSTQKPILLLARSGSGKTSLLEQITSEQHVDLRICNINEQIQPEKLYPYLLQSLAINGETYDNVGWIELEQLLQRFQHLNIKPVLFVDNAEKLPGPAIERITKLLQLEEDGRRLLQVVFAYADRTDSLISLNLAPHVVNLPALDAEEIQAYLMHRLRCVGYSADCPFSDKEIQRLYRQSGGNLASLHTLAHQSLLSESAKKTNPRFSLPFSIANLARIIGATLAIILIIIVLIFQDQINSWMTPSQGEIQQVEQPDLIPDDEVTTVIAIPEQKSKESEQTPREELANLLAELDSGEQQAVSEPMKTEQVDIQPEVVQQTDSSETKPVVEEKQNEPQEPKPVAETALQPSIIKGQDWILAQRGSDYTFQLMGAWTQQEVDDYIEKYALTGDIAQFTSDRNGKPWHVLIYGVYPSKDEAVKASKSWPAPLNSIPTWLRRFDSVQKQIKEKAVTP